MKELLVQGIKMMEKAKLFKVAAGIFTEIFDAFQIPRVLLLRAKCHKAMVRMEFT